MQSSKIMLVGEAWGKDEEAERRPFVGSSGRILNGILAQVGLDRSSCYLTNVFNLRPKPTNDVTNLCGPKAEGITPALRSGKYIRREYQPEIDRLFEEIRSIRPNVIVALGATPSWALLYSSGIKKIRGAPAPTAPAVTAKLGFEAKVLPTYHPAAVMRDYSLRPVVIADMFKAVREAEYPEVRRPQREVWIEPTLDDLYEFERRYFTNDPLISADIETKRDQITCIGFSARCDAAIVVPFFDHQTSGSYWPSAETEAAAWAWVRHVLATYRVVGQNFLYDADFLWRGYGIPIPRFEEDTMLLHHALQPELNKSLGFLGSIYTDEASWKFMRDSDTVKRED